MPLFSLVPVSLRTHIHRYETDAGSFPTGPLEIHKYFAKSFIIMNPGPYMGNKFVCY